jgi:aspartyl-tRNA(Asn)/glutamyl-tRNA(Gln) amidotransferase subunit A
VAYASSLDQIGVMTRSVFDNALVLSVIAGNDPYDSSTLPVAPQDYTEGLDGTIPSGLKIGIVDNTLNADGMHQEVVSSIETAIKELEQLGATIHHITLPAIEYSAAAYFILSRAEASSNLARYDGVRYGYRDKEASTLLNMYEDTRHDGFGTEVKKRILVGNYVLSAGHSGEFYENAQQVKRVMRNQFIQAFQEVDLLLMPSQPAPAFKIGAFDVDPLKLDLQDYFTCPMNLAGVPSISIPCGMSSKNLPIGMQLIGPHCAEKLLYRVGHAYEQRTPWHTMHPKLS